MSYRVTDQIIIENARIIFRNFAGKPGKYNKGGKRSFCVFIDDEEQALKLTNDGWNIKTMSPRDEYDTTKYYLNVEVSFNNIPPNMYMVTRRRKTQLNEDVVHRLDNAEFDNIDLTIRPYNWIDDDGQHRVKAYLSTMYATIREDAFAAKYAEEEYPEEESREEGNVPF